ncbi:hypothetical protein D3248_08195 [Leucobacter zeae]|nr:hypothetical protein [Leucobacter zeae]
MLPFDASPAVSEAEQLGRERRRVLRAIAADARIAERVRGLGSAETDGTAEAGTVGHDHAADLAHLDARLDEIATDPESGVAVRRALELRARTLRLALAARRERKDAEASDAAADAIVARAAAGDRDLTRGEAAAAARLRRSARAAVATDTMSSEAAWRERVTDATVRDGVIEALGTMRIREARRQLRDGLLLTAQMRGIIAEALPAILRGDPVLLVGETGGAKTALAEYLSRHGAGLEPELVSGYGDITSAQLIGSHELRAEAGATVSAFVPGPLLRAMAEGRPVILDEVNAMPPEFLKRLNRILQLRPGDTLGVQEDAGRVVTIAEGFAIIATANEQTPHRYRGLDRLSAELINRFGANGYRVHYPDAGRRYEEFPAENGLLAVAAIADPHGRLPAAIGPGELMRAVRAAFISQQVFAGSHGEGFAEFVSTEREIDGRPGLEESVIAPRTLVAILQKAAGSAGAVTLERALGRFVEGVMHREDRRVLGLILEGQGFRIG